MKIRRGERFFYNTKSWVCVGQGKGRIVGFSSVFPFPCECSSSEAYRSGRVDPRCVNMLNELKKEFIRDGVVHLSSGPGKCTGKTRNGDFRFKNKDGELWIVSKADLDLALGKLFVALAHGPKSKSVVVSL